MEELASPIPATSIAPIAPFALNVVVNPKNPRLDIVFVHGFRGHPERTWTSKNVDTNPRNESQSHELNDRPSKIRKLMPFAKSRQGGTKSNTDSVYWPRDLVPGIAPGARVLSYGYDTKVQPPFGPTPSTHTLYDISNDFSIALAARRRDEPDRQIIFVAHSLGGIVVKDLLRACSHSTQNHLRPPSESTIGIIFFGTPHFGADPGGSLVHFGERLLKTLGYSANDHVRSSLLPNSERLRELRDIFEPMVRKHRWKIHSFQEQYGLKALGGQKVVEDTSSCMNIPDLEIVEHINQDHGKMCRFYGTDDPEFRKVEAALKRMLSDIADKQAEAKREKYLRIMLSLKFDQMNARMMTVEKAHIKTCTWIFQTPEYLDWVKDEKDYLRRGFLWMKGRPGTGKSTIMKFVFIEAKKSKKKDFVFSFFFNARGSQLEKSTEGMYRSLIVQILEQFPHQQCIFDSPEFGFSIEPSETWAIELLKELLRQALLGLADVPIVLFIDGLDECDEDEVRDLIRLFEDLGNENSSIQLGVFFSSRHYPHITMQFGFSLILESQNGHHNDIATYLRSELKIGQGSLAKRIREELLEKSHGVFIWVVLVVRILNKEYDSGNVHTLRQRIAEIPSNMRSLFEDIILRDGQNQDRMLLCIQWILFANEPLEPFQLYFAIRHGLEPNPPQPWDQEDITKDTVERYLLHSSKGLAEITKSSRPTVQFIHESVREFFLKNNELARFWPGIDPRFEASSHEKLKQMCLNYTNMNLEVFKSVGVDVTVGPAASYRNLTNLFSWFRYCVSNVLYHASMAEKGGIDQRDFINSFDCLGWVSKNNFCKPDRPFLVDTTASLLYMLAWTAVSYNIQHCSSSDDSWMPSCLKMEDESRGCPFFVSVITRRVEACNKFRHLILSCSLDGASASPQNISCLQQPRPHFTPNQGFAFSRRKSVLEQLVASGNEDLVLSLIQRWHPMLNDVQHGGNALLHGSARDGYTDVVRCLLETGRVDPDCMAATGWTPLLLAARGGHAAIIKCLLNTGKVNLNVTAPDGQNAFLLAVKSGKAEAVKSFLSKVDPNTADNDGRTQLSWAVEEDHESIVKVLLETPKIDTNLADKNGMTPMLWAIAKNNDSAVSLLLGAPRTDPNHADNNGATPLLCAIIKENEVIVKLLLEAPKINPNLADNNGMTPLSLAVETGNETVVSLLLGVCGIVPFLADKEDKTPLSRALANGKKSIIEILLEPIHSNL